MLTEREAIEIAIKEFSEHECIDEYDVTARVDPDENRWIVSFDSKVRLPGGDHLVVVQGVDRKAVFMRGE